MTTNRIQLRILASFGVALLVIATGWVGAGALSSAMGARARLQRTRDIVDAARSIKVSLLDAEASARGYLLTMDPEALAPYERAIAEEDPLASLRQLLQADPGLQATLERLAMNIGEKRSELARAIDVSRTRGVDFALHGILQGNGKRLTDAIRLDLDHLVDRERATRDDYELRVGHKLSLARAVVLSGTLVAFGLAVLVNLSLMAAARANESSLRLVEAQTAQLKRQTESLLQHERQLGEELQKQESMSLALQRSNEELDQFAYATSHDLKAPLRGIMNLASFVEEDLGGSASPEVKKNLHLLRGRARRLESLIEGILAYARAGRVRSKPEVVETEALLREVIELIAPPSTCRIDLKGPLPTLQTERVPLQQVFMNLIQNSIKHGCPAGAGHIEVSAERTEDGWSFRVHDHGPGIPPAYHDRVFGIFQTLAPRDQVEGTGIGLAVVKKLVESHGGRITLESEAQQGATFRFTWPTEPTTEAM